jgi:microcystin-dependent protein
MADHYVGEICAFAFDTVPDGWFPCDGRILPWNAESALLAVIGNTYGGVPFQTYALPNLQGTVPVGADVPAPGVTANGNAGATLAVNWCIARTGVFPVRR